MPSDSKTENFDLSSTSNGISSIAKQFEINTTRTLTYLSSPAEVSMANWWFALATIDHFWIRRRFDVFRRLAGSLIPMAGEIAEIGCGHGLLQRQIEETYGREVTGFDLNEFALKQSLARQHDIQVAIGLYIESLQNLVQQTAVLRRDTDPDVELRSVLSEMKDNRAEFDCFRPGAENKKETPHSSKRESSYL